MNINFNELDSRTAKLLSSGIRRTLGKWATAHLKANGGRLSRDDRKSYFSKPKQENLLLKKRNKNESTQDLSRLCKLIEQQVAEELEFTGWITGSRVWDDKNNIINVSIQGDDYDISDEYDADFWIEVLDDGGFEVEWWRHEPVHADSVSDVVDIIVDYANNF